MDTLKFKLVGLAVVVDVFAQTHAVAAMYELAGQGNSLQLGYGGTSCVCWSSLHQEHGDTGPSFRGILLWAHSVGFWCDAGDAFVLESGVCMSALTTVVPDTCLHASMLTMGAACCKTH